MAKEKIAYIMRGLPGSGKSTIAQELANGKKAAIHSTDSYFMVKGEYKYDRTKLGKHHGRNFTAFEHSCHNGIPIVICDNTNTVEREYGRYVEAAKKYGYEVRIVIAGEMDANTCFKRCTHGVPKETIEKMKERFKL